ncbi:MAG: AAA-like domain-containing protein [Caldilineaceae bacterium]|nr:AAA-like domain-containing protein [Caldilineaceae bacterium]
MRIFNTTGPVRPSQHYCLPPLERFNLNDVLFLIDQQKYFVLHAPRQVGKTSYLLALMEYLNAEGTYRCLYFNVEAAQAMRENVEAAMRVIVGGMASQARIYLNDLFLDEIMVEALEKYGTGVLNAMITRWAAQSEKPLILLIDEIDTLIGDTLISVLRQLRAGYPNRPADFPQSVILCGVRDVRDYRIHSSRDKMVITGGSAFNIKVASLRLGNFSHAEVAELYRQHTDETGQAFTPEAMTLVWELTEGQPWLVNALGYELCFRTEVERNNRETVTAERIQQAKEQIIQRRETHLDQLTDKLQEERVRNVIEPILAGQTEPERLPLDDVQYVEDLGLITTHQQLRIANKIYQEVIPRELTYTTQLTITHETAWYVAPDGRLDMEKLLIAFQEFFRLHSEHWVERFDYKEAGPQLLLQAFLQRIINGGGRIEREYGLGRERTDLLIVWPYDEQGAVQRVVIETKLRHGKLDTVITKGLAQTWAYMDRSDTTHGHLIIFDRSTSRSWDEKIFKRNETHNGVGITVWGM